MRKPAEDSLDQVEKKKRVKLDDDLLSKLMCESKAFGEPEVEVEGDPPAKEDLDDTVSEQSVVLLSPQPVDDVIMESAQSEVV